MRWNLPASRLWRNNTLFYKILLYFLSLLIPIIVIGLIVYKNVDHLIKKEASAQLANNLDSSVATIEMVLKMVQTVNNALLFSDTFQQNLLPNRLMTDSDRVNTPSIVKAIATNRSIISPAIHNIFVFIDEEKVYSGDGVVQFDTFFETFSRFADRPKSFWVEKLAADRLFEIMQPDEVINEFNHSSHRVLPSATTQYVNGRPATLVTTLSIPALTAMLENNSIYAATSYLALDARGGTLLRSERMEGGTAERIGQAFAAAGGPQVLFLEVNGAPSIAVHVKSDDFGWQYMAVTPISAFNGESVNILKLIFWICLSLIVIGIAFSFIFSINLYNPIRNIRTILQQTGHTGSPDGTWRGRGELERIGERVDRLVHDNLNTARKVQRFTNELVEQFFRNVLGGNEWEKPDTVTEILQDIGLGESGYLCCCFKFRFKDTFYRDIVESDRLLIQEKLRNVLGGIMLQHVNGYLFEYEPCFYVGIMNLRDEPGRLRLHQALEKVKKTLEYDTVYCHLTIGVGNRVESIGEINYSFHDAVTAIDYQPVQTDLQVLDAAQMEIERTYFYSFLDENKLINALKSGDEELLREEVAQLIRLNRDRGVSNHYIGVLLADMFNTGCRYVTEKGLSVSRFVSKENYAELTRGIVIPDQLDRRIGLLHEFYGKLIAETAVKTEGKAASVVSLVTAYIEAHYGEDIYLEKVADEIGLSAKYVSRIFKERTGSTIIDYIGLIRMAKAKELLSQTDLKISDIADRIGIFSRTTFLRMFKKHEGVSPMEYRKLSGQDKETPPDATLWNEARK
ncbi:helix-turn-helix transcriptional regulator [Paenibacillus mesophilus]|uniref:helix-turn-helix transcriptional regulator n=1 Tax=Paenibacillus mesophilus TaxID=2582849 RepID=UPI0013050C26|nr:AraC family transcriptional regulator [Paenibacillus mesophilus]